MRTDTVVSFGCLPFQSEIGFGGRYSVWRGSRNQWKVTDRLHEVLTGVDLEQIDEGTVHKLHICAGSRFTVWSQNSRTILDVVGQIVNEAVIICHTRNFLRSAVVPMHDGHALKVPVRTWIIGDLMEVMVFCIGICRVRRTESGPGHTIAKCADLSRQ